MINASSGNLRFTNVSVAFVRDFIKSPFATFTNCIGHPDTDAIVKGIIGMDYASGSRITVTMNPSDEMVVAQYSGPRLPEGATKLPEGASIKFVHLTLS
jgi:hypothetical protein